MPSMPLVTYSLTTTGATAGLSYHILRTTPVTGDVLQYLLTTTTLLQESLTAPFRVLGALIEMDRGDGVLAPIFGSQREGSISIDGSLEGYGARTMTFALRDQSPLREAARQAEKAVRVTGYIGVPGFVQSRVVFQGFTREVEYDVVSRTLTVHCQDASLTKSGTKIAYNLDVGTVKSRLEILSEICATYTIPGGSWDLGPNDGGLVSKGITVGGDRELLAWINEFLSPIGRRARWDQNGRLHIAKYDGSSPPVRTLLAGDAIVTLSTPPTNDPNSVTMSSTIFSYVGRTGRRTVTHPRRETRGVYAPKCAVRRQDKTTGIVSNLTFVAEETEQVVGAVEVTEVFEGGTLMERHETHYGFYAPLACSRKQSGAGVVTHNTDRDVYWYNDGTCRATAQEVFGIVQRVELRRYFDEPGRLRYESTVNQRPELVEGASGYIAPGGTTETPVACYLDDNGYAWQNDVEVLDGFAPVTEVKFYYVDDQDRIFAVQESTVIETNIERHYYEWPGNIMTVDLWVRGPANAKRYFIVSTGSWSRWTIGGARHTDYMAIDENSHQVRTYSGSVVNPFEYLDIAPPPYAPPTTVIVPGTIPYTERNTATQTQQYAEVTVRDDVRIAWSKVVPWPLENYFCETSAELETAALVSLREFSAVPVSVEMLVDWLTTEGDTIRLFHRDLADEPVDVVVTEVSISIDTATAENSQRLGAKLYPRHLALAA